MRRIKRLSGIPAGAQCGDRIGKKWLLFMRRIYDHDIAREIAAGEGPGALVIDDGPQCWAIIVPNRATRPPIRLEDRPLNVMGPARLLSFSNVMGPAQLSTSAKQTSLFDTT